MSKRFLILIMVLLFTITVAGCVNDEIKPVSSSDQDYLTALKGLEGDSLKELSPLEKDIRNSYEDWEKGIISRDEFKDLCEKDYIPRVNAIKAKYKGFIAKSPMPNSLKENEDFTALNKGKLLRSDVGIFLVKVVKGNGVLKEMPKDGKVDGDDIKFEHVSDNDLRKMYQEFMVEDFKSNLNELQKVLAK